MRASTLCLAVCSRDVRIMARMGDRNVHYVISQPLGKNKHISWLRSEKLRFEGEMFCREILIEQDSETFK